MPELIRDPLALRRASRELRRQGLTLGLVPTMGALHEGHLSLVRAARAACDRVCVSLFVNPTQFGPGEDFAAYPRTMERDLELLREERADLCFAPAAPDVFPAQALTFLDMRPLTEVLCGASRPGHFRGVLTVVLKLFLLAEPARAYFGAKDYQQSLLIRRMVRDLFLDLVVEVQPTVREDDGLARSSRNAYLSPESRRRATALYQALSLAQRRVEEGERGGPDLIAAMRASLERSEGVQVEYVAVVDPETLEPVRRLQGRARALIAARVGGTRLIDNLELVAGE